MRYRPPNSARVSVPCRPQVLSDVLAMMTMTRLPDTMGLEDPRAIIIVASSPRPSATSSTSPASRWAVRVRRRRGGRIGTKRRRRSGAWAGSRRRRRPGGRHVTLMTDDRRPRPPFGEAASVDPTDACKATLRHFGRIDRRTFDTCSQLDPNPFATTLGPRTGTRFISGLEARFARRYSVRWPVCRAAPSGLLPADRADTSCKSAEVRQTASGVVATLNRPSREHRGDPCPRPSTGSRHASGSSNAAFAGTSGSAALPFSLPRCWPGLPSWLRAGGRASRKWTSNA